MSVISQILKEEGTIKLTKKQFSKIISEYYQKRYKINGIFEFLDINYVYIDNNYEILKW